MFFYKGSWIFVLLCIILSDASRTGAGDDNGVVYCGRVKPVPAG